MIAQLVPPPPVIARGWSTDARIIISLAWQTVPPTHKLPPTCHAALLLFLLLTRLLSSKTFCDRKLFPIHSGIIYPSSLDELQLLLQVESSSHFNPNHDNKLPLNLLLLRLRLLFLSCCCCCWASSFWIHIRVRIAHIESCFYCRCRCRFHYINRLPRPHPSPRPGSHSPAPSSSCIVVFVAAAAVCVCNASNFLLLFYCALLVDSAVVAPSHPAPNPACLSLLLPNCTPSSLLHSSKF